MVRAFGFLNFNTQVSSTFLNSIMSMIIFFAISEYLDFSLEDLLRHSIRLIEPEIAFIISRVRWIASLPSRVLIVAGAGWYPVHLVKGT
jgi:hypothetical protein